MSAHDHHVIRRKGNLQQLHAIRLGLLLATKIINVSLEIRKKLEIPLNSFNMHIFFDSLRIKIYFKNGLISITAIPRMISIAINGLHTHLFILK